MKKKLFVLEFDKGVDEDFKLWTKEAVQEFINLFPCTICFQIISLKNTFSCIK